MNKGEVLEYIRTHNLIGIKAGLERPEFLEIWMVVVKDRIFARSWGLAEKSWYNTFLNNSAGQIKCNEAIYSIKAVVPEDVSSLTNEINDAYLTKYNFGQNRKYATGIIEDIHVEKTMEFVIDRE